jgi:hypothetical protein
MIDQAPTIYGTVTIKRRLPSQNKCHGSHWRTYRKEFDVWAWMMGLALPLRTSPPTTQVCIRIISYRNRLCDFANLVGGSKPIPDILKRRGYIRDDKPEWFHCEYAQVQVPKTDERTVIEFLSPITPSEEGESDSIDSSTGPE